MAMEVAKIGRSIKKRLNGISEILGGQPDFPFAGEGFPDVEDLDFEEELVLASPFDDEEVASPLVLARFFFVLFDCSSR